jgi:hypothetical protein
MLKVSGLENHNLNVSFSLKDGDHYTQLLEDNTNDINELCAQYEPYINQPEDSPTFIPNEEGKQN